MSRERRLNRNLPVDIDLDVMERLVKELGATQDQFRYSYSRVLKRTASKLKMRAKANISERIEPREMNMVRKRLMDFEIKRGSTLDSAKLWFGLNAIKVKDLKGRIRGKMLPHHKQRDPATGRFAKANRKAQEAAGFEPKGKMLQAKTYPNGEVARSKREGRRTVVIRDPLTRRVREAEIDIYAPMLDYIEDNAFADAMETLMMEFEQDLRARVKLKISV